MPRRAYPSNSLSALVRKVFGLTQADLARFLHIKRAQVAHVEAGRSTFSREVDRRLTVLLEAQPVPEGRAGAWPKPAAEPAGALRREPLEKRLKECRYRALVIRYELEKTDKRLAELAHRRRALAALRAYLLPADGSIPWMPGDKVDVAYVRFWLDTLDADTAAAPVPDPTERALVELRLRLLDAEATALEGLLADLPPAPAV
ncbi:XRE family transcriptional regulator [Hymenobacter gummosus]|uniref:XRE family transcriptional regulator n=1 Tax=Hymenobacter gummosus TaxID=1776032 RepID=A0A3S0IP01_9BACT|nr:helix-turn-helix transcriptional regulator [Hymenobacter gummosus]RTQ50138.1 XRE family transcriptional regulator [Hymenobacter gummosus]